MWIVMTLGLLLGSGLLSPAHNAADAEKDSVPRIGRLAGVNVGLSSTRDLERRFGRGMKRTGAHPHSGRVWYLRSCWSYLSVDGADPSREGGGSVIIDFVRITRRPPAGINPSGVPVVSSPVRGCKYLGRILPGMSRAKVRRMLERESNVNSDQDGTMLTATGRVVRRPHYSYARWRAVLDFSHDELDAVTLKCE